MMRYKITVQMGKNIEYAGTKKQTVGSEYVHAVVITASEDSSWFTFDKAKEGAISCIKRTISVLSVQKADSPEPKVTKLKLKRLVNFREEDILYVLKKGQNAVSL